MIYQKQFFARVAGSLLLLATASRLFAAVYNVGNLTDLANDINLAQPGDQIILANGVYNNTNTINISCAGTATQPILIAAQSVGGAQIAGTAGFYFSGASYVTLQGFFFTYSNNNQNGLQIDTASSHCRVTRNIFQTDPIQYWCFVQGDDTEVDHNLFQNKVQKGEYVTLDGNHTSLRIAQRLWLHDNDFFNNQYAGGNGGESTRLGLGIFKLISAWSVVENNLYLLADGDAETISVKSSDDVIRYNTITNSVGYISLRQANRARVEGNFIFNSAGIKFYADDHLVFNNYLQGATNGIAFGSGDWPEITDSDNSDNSGPHAATHRARVEFNTLVNCPVYFDLNNQGSCIPTDCLVANNLLQGNSGYFVSAALATGLTNFTWLTNIFWGSASTSYSPAGGYLKINPLLATNTATPFHIASTSPAINASYNAPDEVVSDMDGQSRPAIPAIGADEYSTAPVTRRPLGTNDVGPFVTATNFAVVALPWSQTIMPGLGTSFTNLLSAYNGFTNLVTLSVANLPPNSTASFDSTTITNGMGFSVLSVTISNSTPPGRYSVVVTAASATFTNTTIAGLTVGNLPTTNWSDADIGQPQAQGAADCYSYATNVFLVKGGGAQIFGASDQFNFAFQPWTNGLQLTARVATQPATSLAAESGVMIRETTNAASKYVDVVVTPQSINMEARTTTGGNAVQLATFTAANSPVGTNSPSWVRLLLLGDKFTGFASSNGVNWVELGATNLNMGSTLAGLAVCAHDNTQLNSSTFDGVDFFMTNFPPTITNQPVSQVVAAGNTATFAVGAGGSAPLGYQWWFNSTNLLPGATGATFSINNAQGTNAGSYFVVVTNAYGSATSTIATLTVNLPFVVTNYSTPGSWVWICPTNVISVRVECWGGGGAGGGASRNGQNPGNATGGGGAGGSYSRLNAYPVVAGNTYYINVGAGGTNQLIDTAEFSGGDSWFNTNNSPSATVLAKGGGGGETVLLQNTTTRHGAGGTNQLGSLGDVVFVGGSGGTPTNTAFGGSGGGSGGTNSPGLAGDPGSGIGATAVPGGGNGGNANPTSGSSGSGQSPTNSPGGGGGGSRCASTTAFIGGAGSNGLVVLTFYTAPTVTSSPAIGIGTTTATLIGSAADNGNPISSCGFFYKTSSGVTTNDIRIAAGSGSGPFSATPVFSPGTHYYWKAYALNAGGMVLSSELNFLTLSAAPPAVTSVSMSSDRTAFSLTGTGAASQAYALWTASNLAPPVVWVPVATNNSDAHGIFSFTDLQVTNFMQRFYRVGTP
jgi:Chondroitinase B/Immunoglobulin I-set domain